MEIMFNYVLIRNLLLMNFGNPYFPSILICRKKDKNTKINHKNATKRAFFMVKCKYNFREG